MMNQPELLRRLGAGESIQQVLIETGWSRAQFDDWWQAECQRRVPSAELKLGCDRLRGPVRVVRDERGLPHVEAENTDDAYYGFGFAVAQDRLFQLDYLRRRARGTLAEILGPAAVDSDLLYHTLDLQAVAERELAAMTSEIRGLVESYAQGVNAWMQACRDGAGQWPIEFDLLDYRPELWSATDSLLITGEFRWYLTGRFPVILAPELVKRAVGTGPLYELYLGAELDEECILPAGSYRPRNPVEVDREGAPWGSSAGGAEDGGGSNNWVLAGRHTQGGQPLLASDPHVPFQALSLWHEVHLRTPTLNVAGAAYAGMPAIMIGRNERVAWGITNNISSLRDLYEERLEEPAGMRSWYDGDWHPLQERSVEIVVRGGETVRHTVRSTRNGPLVDGLFPAGARHLKNISLRWIGHGACEWVSTLIRGQNAADVAGYRASLVGWSAPTFSVVMADVEGQIGYQCTGAIPLRTRAERGLRPGWEPQHQWTGVIPWEVMPQLTNPDSGFIVTANNRICPDDYPYPLSGTWITGYRARRIRETLAAGSSWGVDDQRRLQTDVYSGRAAKCLPWVLRLLSAEEHDRLREALACLANWDLQVRANSAAAAIFNVFFAHWSRRVVAARLPADQVDLVLSQSGPLAVAVLCGDERGWFPAGQLANELRLALEAALDELTPRLGADATQWCWGALHVLAQKHPLSGRGELADLLDHPRLALDGDAHTVNSATPDATQAAWLGANYRLVVDLSDECQGFWSVDGASVSGVAGSAHYQDQLTAWHQGKMYYCPLSGPIAGPVTILEPRRC
ncbi:MAG: penicillin acylase family protein [Planctomycetota bacterium]